MTDVSVVHVPSRLKEGINLVEKGALDGARSLFEGYLEMEPHSVLAQSFVGMLRVVQGGQVSQGLDMCQEALRRDPKESFCYLNLAKAYLTSGDRYLCVRTLQRGLKVRSPHRDYILTFYRTIGIRRPAVLRFLSRDNPINEFLGRLTWKMKKGHSDKIAPA